MDANEVQDQTSHVVAIRCRPELLASIERAAASEGLSKADVVRRAVIRDLRASRGMEPLPREVV